MRAWSLVFVAVISCAAPSPRATPSPSGSAGPTAAAAPRAPDGLPELADWPGGLPPLDRVHVAGFKPALEWAMAHKRAEIERIARSPEPPTFANTVAALERAGQPLADVRALFDLWGRSYRDPAFDAVEGELASRLADFDAALMQDTALARRVDAVYAARQSLDAEAQALTEQRQRAFRLAGAQLGDAPRARLRQIDARLAELYVSFMQNLSAGGAATAVVLSDEAELAGLPPAFREQAAAAAAQHQHPGAWLIGNHYVAVQTVLAHATRREVREKVWRAFEQRASQAPHDNTPVVRDILALRRERAVLLGYESHAQVKLADSMMRTVEPARAWLSALARPATTAARRDIEELQRAADQEQARRGARAFALQPWDLRYYEERVKQAKYGLDESEISAYLDPEQLREGMFWAAGQLFGLVFTPLPGASLPHPDVRVWAVSRAAGGAIGYLYVDAYARPGKQNGAWTDTYREQQRLVPGRLPVVAVSYNLTRPRPGARGAITWFDGVGLFHEFGHALQALLSDVTYPSLAGLNVSGDTLETASQWFERYLATPELLRRFTRHERSGQSMPPALVARIERARVFCEGIRTTEMLQSALIDLRLHAAAAPGDGGGEARRVAAELGVPAEVHPVGRATQAVYLFGGDNYSAQFYSYLWSDELAAELYEAFVDAGGPYDTGVAERLRAQLLSRGAAADPAAAFAAFRGRAPRLDALLRKRGLSAGAAR